jgi:carbonic anhydrase/acetyltransferase-like protein (isoleucine patch superfamily)
MQFLRPEAFFDLDSYEHRDLFADCRYAWEALGKISSYLEKHLDGNVRPIDCFRRPLPHTVALWRGKLWQEGVEFLGGDVTKGTLSVRIQGEETSEAAVLCAGSVLWDDRVYLGPGSLVEPGALIKGPTIIGAHTEVRQGAYIRGKCIVGNNCVVGHTTEMKTGVMLNGAKAGHFAYIGDSILGHLSNLGAGTKLANLKIKEGNVHIKVLNEYIDTGLRKLGAVLADRVEIGCNAVTNPGALLSKGCLVFPVTSVRSGYHEPNSILRPS